MKQPHLVAVTPIAQTAATVAPPAPRVERVRFCSRCGTTDEDTETQLLPYGFDRVCDRCGMGVMLGTPRRALPVGGAAFVIVTREGRISAVSEQAERLLGDESDLLGTPFTSSITSLEEGDDLFARRIARASGGGREVLEVRVSASAPAARRLGPLVARIASCGPPRAALVVLERAPHT